jgi:23S rRNA (guanine745-N1)-methyltransferase
MLSNKKEQGDDDMMLQARRRFLETGYYETLILGVATHIETYAPGKNLTILDLGCGEGWYLRRLQELRHDRDDSFYACDIAKQAVKMTAKNRPGTYFVANANNIPLANQSCDVIISIFSPVFEDELTRCLKPWWITIIVGPWSHHLYKFIEMIWDVPHGHKAKEENYQKFQVLASTSLTIPMSLQAPAIQDLFMMTPYYRQASQSKQQAIMDLQTLDIEAQFVIQVFQKPLA